MHISREIMVIRRFWRYFRVTKEGGILCEASIIKRFLISAIISFFAYISWNNGFTAILTKFSGHQRRRYFMRRINSQMVFYFGPWFGFLHIPREIMVLQWFWWYFRVTKGGGILWEVSIPKWFSISKHNFVFCIYLVK